jgi:Family of unknown function (DUF6152)
MRSRLAMFSAIALTLVLAAPAWAHHSVSGQFDTTKPIVLKGTVSKVDWMNPHVYIYLDVKETDGSVTTWALSSLPTAMMRKAGLSKETLIGAPGETVTINAVPARDGTKHLGWISKITYADGHFFLLAGE